MVQRIQKFATLAVHNIYEGESARQNTAGIFYVCTLDNIGVAPVWNCNGTTALVVLCNGSATPFFIVANQTNCSVMHNAEKSCLAGNNSTQQATDCPRKGLPELTEILSDFLLDMPDFDETREALDTMFFDAMTGGDPDDFPSQQHINKMFWCKKDLDTLIDYAQQIEGMRKYIHSMRDFLRKEKEKAEKTELPSAKLTLV